MGSLSHPKSDVLRYFLLFLFIYLGNLRCGFGVFAFGVRAISEAEGCDRSSTGSISGILRSAAPSKYSGHLIGTTKFLQFKKDNAMIIDFFFFCFRPAEQL